MFHLVSYIFIEMCIYVYSFKQIEGLVVGLPLGPTLANVFMCFCENNWLDSCPNTFKPFYYQRYVDDIFIV